MCRGGLCWSCAVLRAAGDLTGDAPCCEPQGISPEMRHGARGRRSWGDLLFFLAPDPTAARLASSGYGWTGRKFRPVRRRLVVTLANLISWTIDLPHTFS
ncbi:hypothetical protein VPH35_031072 [Triticum aestivum]